MAYPKGLERRFTNHQPTGHEVHASRQLDSALQMAKSSMTHSGGIPRNAPEIEALAVLADDFRPDGHVLFARKLDIQGGQPPVNHCTKRVTPRVLG